MILAAGHGKRMRPLTDHTPKPLLMVGGKPLIVWHIENLKAAGFDQLVINIAWLGKQIPETLGDGSRYGVSIRYSDEQAEGALETAGGIIKALPLLSGDHADQPFLVVNGDTWCDYPYHLLKQRADTMKDDLAHLVLVTNPQHNPTGDFALQSGRLNNNTTDQWTFSGIGIYHPMLFAGLLPGKRPLAPLLRQAIDAGRISGELFEGDWRDIGTPQRLAELDQQLTATQQTDPT